MAAWFKPAAARDLPDAVVSLYGYEFGSDTTTAADTVGSNDATVSGATFTTTDPGKHGVSLDLDGTDDIATSDGTVDLPGSGVSDGFSVFAWVKTQGAPDGSDFAFNWYVDGQNECGLLWGGTEGVWRVWLKIGDTTIDFSGTNDDTDANWHHFAITVTQTEATLYVDGAEDASTTHSEDPTTMGAGTIVHGDRYDGADQNPDVVLDDLGVADAALSASEIQQIMDR